jgi:eukaryotic-like serine/threonine-protein kinase
MSEWDSLVGSIIDAKWKVTKFVEESGDQIILRAKDISTEETVVLRMLRPLGGATAEELEDAFKNFREEAAKLERLCAASTDVEKLVAWGVATVGFAEGGQAVPYCAFEKTDGRTLADKLEAGKPVQLGKALTLLDPIAQALASAHVLSIHHGDVRPENCLYAERYGETKLVLGKWTLASRLGSGMTYASEYAAPEHFRKSYGGTSPATDVYGLALCLVELVSGKRALEGNDFTELMQRATNAVVRPTLRAKGVVCADEIEAAVAKALSVDPKQRYQTAREFWDALAGGRSELVVSLSADGSTPSLPSLPSFPQVPSDPSLPSLGGLEPDIRIRSDRPPEPTSSREDGVSSRTLAVVGAVSLTLLLVGVVMKVTTSASAPPPTTSAPTSSTSSAPSVVPPTSASPTTPATAASAAVTPDDMIKIPAGTFTMGNDKEGPGDRPAHKVTLKSFFIDKHEATAEAYQRCIDAAACTARNVHPKKGFPAGVYGCNTEKDRGNHPANCVDREQAEAYCTWAKKRLPSEAEWEYAARGSDEREYPWGAGAPASCAQAVVSGIGGTCGQRKGTMPVGSAPDGASSFGVLDMAGNVFEWVADGYAPYEAGDHTDPLVPLGNKKGIIRGGSWDYSTPAAKTTFRTTWISEAGNASIGFRCARSAQPREGE